MLLCEIFIPIATALIFLFGFDIRRQHAEKLPFERFIPKKLNKKGRAAFLALVPSVLFSVLLVIIHFLVTNFTNPSSSNCSKVFLILSNSYP